MKRVFILFINFLINLNSFSQDTRGMKPVPLNNGERRVALVIGNKEYKNVLTLKNPVNDALLMKKTLESLGFDVTIVNEASLGQMKAAVVDFEKKLRSDKNSVGFFYYAGHGSEIMGKNYLIPIETPAVLNTEAEASQYLVDLQIVLNSMENAKNRLNIVVLDACRNDPFNFNRGGSANGIINIPQAATGMLIAFATSPGYTAEDGAGNNGVYTLELSKIMMIPNLKIEDVFKYTRTNVKNVSNGRQFPRYDQGIEGDFYLKRENIVNDNKIIKNDVVVPQEVFKPKASIIFDKNFFEYLEGRTFDMGSKNGSFSEKPVRDVSVGNFIFGIKEITMGEYLEFCEKKGDGNLIPNTPPWGWGKEFPAAGISWFDAVEFCNWKSDKENLVPCYKKVGTNVTWNQSANGYRLPTEAEWEFIAKEGQMNYPYLYAGSNDITSIGWTSRNSEEVAHKVGSSTPNNLGVYDLTGNVWEWCWDWYSPTYFQKKENDNPLGPSTGTTRVLKGGAWSSDDTTISSRYFQNPDTKSFDIGFRIVRSSR